MKKLQKPLLWLWMLSKRLYKKPTFLVILILIPVLVMGYAAFSGGESGMLTVGLASKEDSSLVRDIFTQLRQDSNLLVFQIYDNPEEAKMMLQSGKLDAVWIFDGDLENKIREFSQKPVSSNAFITVLEREDSVALMLSREKLNTSVYPYVARQVYLQYLREKVPGLSHLSDEKALTYYDNIRLTNNLFVFEGAAAQQNKQSYLLSPLRGLLGTLILLCALASGMYYIHDKEIGTFTWVRKNLQFLPELGCYMVSVLHVALVSLICLGLCGLAGNLWAELALALLYSLCCATFVMMLRRLCGSAKLLGTLLPLLIVAVLAVCPVFFDLGAMRKLQYLLPPTYYINAVYNSAYFGSVIVYIGICSGIYILAGKLLHRD